MHSTLCSDLLYYRGRVALYAILKAMGIGSGDEVALQAFTCVAVPEGIMASGACPLWVDVERNGFNMDPEDLRQKLTSRTRAIIIQHTYGIPAQMDPLMKVAEDAGLPVIEDCCHTILSSYKGKTVGSFGAASFYSYEWGKPIVAGIGGSAAVHDPVLQKRMIDTYPSYRIPEKIKLTRIQIQYYAFRALYRPRLYWPVRSLFHYLGSIGLAEGNYNPLRQGNIADDFELRMAPVLVRRLRRQMKKLDSSMQYCRKIVKKYRGRISAKVVSHPITPQDSETLFARYPLRTGNKNYVLKAARKANVELSEWYVTPVHPLSGKELTLVHYRPGACRNAEERCREVVTLPTYTAVSVRDIYRAIDFLNGLESHG